MFTEFSKQIIKHPFYSRHGFLNDIALLIWDEPLDMTYINTNSICLPEKEDNFEDLECYVTGWGTSLACMKIIYYLKKLRILYAVTYYSFIENF